MRATTQEQTGGVGLHEVMANLERIGWGPVPNGYHDLGVDLFVQVRDARLYDRGLLVGMQVKGGPSYFGEPKRDGAGELVGWWYREPDAEHFNDWVQHGLPHLLILHDLDTRVSYWVHVAAERVVSTGRGYKILVPADQTIDAAHLDSLLRAAATMKGATPLEGTAGTATVDSLAPGQRLRYALLAPRLVAPHANAGIDRPVSFEEAAALVVLARCSQLERLASRHPSLPSPSAVTEDSEWGWRFVGAMWKLVREADPSGFGPLVNEASSSAHRVAARIVAACCCMDREQHRRAIELLEDDVDDVSPIDYAWMAVQRARARAEIGDVAEAREEAATAQRTLVGSPDDLTSSAIGAAAAELLLRTAAWGEAKFDEAIPKLDTAVSWWRGQLTAHGLADLAGQAFRAWAEDNSTVLIHEDIANNELLAAMLNAHLVGEHGMWRTDASLLAQNTLMSDRVASDSQEYAEALDELRRAGDYKALELVAKQTLSVGPLEALAEATGRIDDSSWTHTAAHANLVLWRYGGDVLDQPVATAAAGYCLDVLADPGDLARRVTPSFVIPPYVVDALAGLIRAADDATHRRTVTMLVEQLPAGAQAVDSGLACLARRLRMDVISPDEQEALLETAMAGPVSLATSAALEVLSETREQARVELIARLDSGYLPALASLRLDDLDESIAIKTVARIVELVRGIVGQARRSSYSYYTMDLPSSLTLLSLRFPNAAQWDVLLQLLEEPQVAGPDKRKACLKLAFNVDKLPEQVQSELRDSIQRMSAPIGKITSALGVPLAGAPSVLASALGMLDGSALAEELARLLAGDDQERYDTALLVATLHDAEYDPVLVTLLGDRSQDVRAQAAYVLGMRVASSHTTRSLAAASLERAAGSAGRAVPAAVVRGIGHADGRSEQALSLLTPLTTHRSAAVREAALRVRHQAGASPAHGEPPGRAS